MSFVWFSGVLNPFPGSDRIQDHPIFRCQNLLLCTYLFGGKKTFKVDQNSKTVINSTWPKCPTEHILLLHHAEVHSISVVDENAKQCDSFHLIESADHVSALMPDDYKFGLVYIYDSNLNA